MTTNSVGLAEFRFKSFILTKVIHEKHEEGWLNPPPLPAWKGLSVLVSFGASDSLPKLDIFRVEYQVLHVISLKRF